MPTLIEVLEHFEKHGNSLFKDTNPIRKGELKIPTESEFDAIEVLGCGQTSIAVLLSEGQVLKLNQKPHYFQRFFDAPVYDVGYLDNVPYLIQPFVDMGVKQEDIDFFKRMVEAEEHQINDLHSGQIGFFRGRLVLVDPWAVCNRQTKLIGVMQYTGDWFSKTRYQRLFSTTNEIAEAELLQLVDKGVLEQRQTSTRFYLKDVA